MIHEVIVTTISETQKVHIAPMGIRLVEEQIIISPFKPSQTLENILNNNILWQGKSLGSRAKNILISICPKTNFSKNPFYTADVSMLNFNSLS